MHPSPAPAVALSFCISTDKGCGLGLSRGYPTTDIWGEICGIESRAALSKGKHIFPPTSWLYPPTGTLMSYLLILFVPQDGGNTQASLDGQLWTAKKLLRPWLHQLPWGKVGSWDWIPPPPHYRRLLPPSSVWREVRRWIEENSDSGGTSYWVGVKFCSVLFCC